MRLTRIRRHQSSVGVARSAMTLVELLVVIVLITTLVATAIPVISPGGEGRRLREASRNLNTYLQGAQARAVQTGRSFGVALHRQSIDTGRGADAAKCVRLEYVEVPPTYSGFDETSAVRVAVNPGYNPAADANSTGDDDQTPFFLQFVRSGAPTANLPPGFAPDLLPARFLRPGDVVEVADRRYQLLSAELPTQAATTAASGFFEPVTGELTRFAAAPVGVNLPTTRELLPDISPEHDNSGAELPAPDSLAMRLAFSTPTDPSDDPPSPHWTAPVPYRVFRQPVPAAGEPYELPAGVAVDLQASVVSGASLSQLYDASVDYDQDAGEFESNPPRTDPVLVLFSPEGGVSLLQGQVVSAGDANRTPRLLAPRPVTGTIALCVGRNELIPGEPFAEVADPLTKESFANPINLASPALTSLSEADAVEETNNYNWLNLESRWVIVGGQTGAVETIEGVTPEGLNTPEAQASILSQIGAVLENVANRRRAGGN